MTVQEKMEAKRIARSRIHVERAIEGLKKYRLLIASYYQKYICYVFLLLPLSLSPIFSQVVYVCGRLVNFQKYIVKK